MSIPQTPGENIKVKIMEIKGKCPYFNSVGSEYNLENMLPCNLCLKAFHTAYPYYLTFLHGGWFRWARRKNLVIAQCPGPDNSLVMEMKLITKEKAKSVAVKIIGKRGTCQKGHSVGDTFELGPENSLNFCPRAFDALYPYYLTLSSGKEAQGAGQDSPSALVACPSHFNTVVFKIYRDEPADS